MKFSTSVFLTVVSAIATTAVANRFDIRVEGSDDYDGQYITPVSYGGDGTQYLGISTKDRSSEGFEFASDNSLETKIGDETYYGFLAPYSTVMPKMINFEKEAMTDGQLMFMYNNNGYLTIQSSIEDANWYLCDGENVPGVLKYSQSDEDGKCHIVSLKVEDRA